MLGSWQRPCFYCHRSQSGGDAEDEKGIDKNDLSREEFLKYAFEWKEKYGGIIYNQMQSWAAVLTGTGYALQWMIIIIKQ